MGTFRVLAGDFEETVDGRLNDAVFQGKTLELLHNPRGKRKLFGARWLKYTFKTDVVGFVAVQGNGPGEQSHPEVIVEASFLDGKRSLIAMTRHDFLALQELWLARNFSPARSTPVMNVTTRDGNINPFKGLFVLAFPIILGISAFYGGPPMFISFVLVLVIMLAALVFLAKPIARAGVPTRKRALAFMLSAVVGVGLTAQAEDSQRMAELKQADPKEYLDRLEKRNKSRWLAELKEMDPAKHRIEADRLAAEKAEQAIKQAAAEEERRRAAKLQKIRDAEEAKNSVERQKIREAQAAQIKLNEQYDGLHCLSAWDGSQRELVRAFKPNLRNPRSFEHVRTTITPRDQNGQHHVAMRYRAENGFGGMSMGAVSGVVRSADCSLVRWHGD